MSIQLQLQVVMNHCPSLMPSCMKPGRQWVVTCCHKRMNCIRRDLESHRGWEAKDLYRMVSEVCNGSLLGRLACKMWMLLGFWKLAKYSVLAATLAWCRASTTEKCICTCPLRKGWFGVWMKITSSSTRSYMMLYVYRRNHEESLAVKSNVIIAERIRKGNLTPCPLSGGVARKRCIPCSTRATRTTANHWCLATAFSPNII